MPQDDDFPLPDFPPLPKRKPGRPKGSRNKKTLSNRLAMEPVITPPPVWNEQRNAQVLLDFKYADPETLAARNMSLIDHAQQALRHMLTQGFQADGKSVSGDDIEKIVALCAALDRAATGMLRVQKAAQEIQKNLSPKQVLEKAILKIMGQDTATQRYVLRRIEDNLKSLKKRQDKVAEVKTATDAIAELSK